MLRYGEGNIVWESRNMGVLGLLYPYNKGRLTFFVIFLMNFGVKPGFKYQF